MSESGAQSWLQTFAEDKAVDDRRDAGLSLSNVDYEGRALPCRKTAQASQDTDLLQDSTHALRTPVLAI